MYQKLRLTLVVSYTSAIILLVFCQQQNNVCHATSLSATLSDEDLYQLIDFATNGQSFETRPEIYYAAAPSSAPNLNDNLPIQQQQQQLEEQQQIQALALAQTEAHEKVQEQQQASTDQVEQQKQPTEQQKQQEQPQPQPQPQQEIQTQAQPGPEVGTDQSVPIIPTVSVPIQLEISSAPPPLNVDLTSSLNFIPYDNNFHINNGNQQVSTPVPTQLPSPSPTPSTSPSSTTPTQQTDLLSNTVNLQFVPYNYIHTVDPHSNSNLNLNLNLNPSQQYQTQPIQLPSPSPSPSPDSNFNFNSYAYTFTDNNPNNNFPNSKNIYNNNNNNYISPNNLVINNGNNNYPSQDNVNVNLNVNGNGNINSNANSNDINTQNYYHGRKPQDDKRTSTIEIISSLELPSKHTQYVQDRESGLVHIQPGLAPYDNRHYPEQQPTFAPNPTYTPNPTYAPNFNSNLNPNININSRPNSRQEPHSIQAQESSQVPSRVVEAHQFFADNQIFPSQPSSPQSTALPPQQPQKLQQLQQVDEQFDSQNIFGPPLHPTQSPTLQLFQGFGPVTGPSLPTLIYAPPPSGPIYAPPPNGPIYAPPPLGPIYAPPPPLSGSTLDHDDHAAREPLQNHVEYSQTYSRSQPQERTRQERRRQPYHNFVHEQAVQRFIQNGSPSTIETKYPDGRALSHPMTLENVQQYPRQHQQHEPSQRFPFSGSHRHQSVHVQQESGRQRQASSLEQYPNAPQQQQQQTQQRPLYTVNVHQENNHNQRGRIPLSQQFTNKNSPQSEYQKQKQQKQQRHQQFQSNIIPTAQPIPKFIQDKPSINQIADSKRPTMMDNGDGASEEEDEEDEDDITNSDETSHVIVNDDGTTSPLTSSEERALLEQEHEQQPEVEIRHNNGQPIVTVKTKRIISRPNVRPTSSSSLGTVGGSASNGRSITKSVVTTRVVAQFKKPKTTKPLTSEQGQRVSMNHRDYEKIRH